MFAVRRIVGASMLPSFKPGRLVLALRCKNPKIGDVVIAKINEREVIKRVFSYNKSGYFLLGDNILHSTDSRKYGFVPANKIIGRVIGGRK
ncbi:MAG: S26 family signal peptidase [Candidatus Woesebacteria bacterium]